MTQNKFHEHLDACAQCAQNPFGLCPTGAQLLGGAVTKHPTAHQAAAAPSLLELVRAAHEKLDESIRHFSADAKSIHGLLQESMDAFERGNVPAAKELIKLALDKECDLFGDCLAIGDEALLAAFGFEADEDTT